MEALKKELRKKSIAVFGNKDSKKALIIWGSTKGAAIEALKKDNFKLIQIKILWPFPSEELQAQLINCERIIAAENNQSGQMCSLIKEHTNIILSKKLLKYSGRHITSKEILEAMK